jgi:hypothetical protein
MRPWAHTHDFPPKPRAIAASTRYAFMTTKGCNRAGNANVAGSFRQRLYKLTDWPGAITKVPVLGAQHRANSRPEATER